MRAIIFILFLYILMPINSCAQISRFDELSNQMFFNVPIYQPDTLILDFIKKYAPYLATKPTPGGWTIHPPLPESDFQSTIHSVIFTKHPYFQAAFTSGRFDIIASEHKNIPGISVQDFHLWFMFDNRRDAYSAFKKLSFLYNKASKKKKLKKIDGRIVAEYSDNLNPDELNTVQFILTENELVKGKYKLYFRIGTY